MLNINNLILNYERGNFELIPCSRFYSAGKKIPSSKCLKDTFSLDDGYPNVTGHYRLVCACLVSLE